MDVTTAADRLKAILCGAIDRHASIFNGGTDWKRVNIEVMRITGKAEPDIAFDVRMLDRSPH